MDGCFQCTKNRASKTNFKNFLWATPPFQANGKALAINDYAGFVKIVSESRYDQILGVHMIGPHVTDMIAEATGMIRLETTTEELAHTVHPHPTLSEAVMEAAHAVLGQEIHM